MNVLSGHVSPETAYVVNDSPYGFRLRCKIRYWLEHTNRGTRFVSQTTNPKRPGEVWNKPKASTYAHVAGCMVLDEKEHVTWVALTEYSDLSDAMNFKNMYEAGLSESAKVRLHNWIITKTVYEQVKTRREEMDKYRAALVEDVDLVDGAIVAKTI